MGLWDTLRSAMGFAKPLVVREPGPFAPTPAARARLDGLGATGHGVHVETVPAHRGRVVTVSEGPSQGPPPALLAGLPITLSDPDLARLTGRVLDFADGRWLVTIALELRARETPNPDSRLYLCDLPLGRGKPAFFVRPHAGDAAPADTDPELPDLAARLLDVPGVVSVMTRDNTVTVSRDPDAPWDGIDRGVDAALREHLLLCGGPIDGGLPDAARGAIEDEIRQVLIEQVLPGVHRDGGDIELVGYSNGVVKVAMHGACKSCPASSATLRLGVERALKEALPGKVERIEAV